MASLSAAYSKFLRSMQITVDEWRDGVGFDLESLREVTPAERDALVPALAERLAQHGDWREMEALATIRTKEAREAIRSGLQHPNLETQLYAARYLAEIGEPVDLEGQIIRALRSTTLSSGLSPALDLAAQHPSPRLLQALLDLALNGSEEQRIHCAAMALYHGGKAEAAFDWNHRPFFLRFGDDDRRVQIEAYKELCRRLGVTPKAG